MNLMCNRCGRQEAAASTLAWRCPCGGPWHLQLQVPPPDSIPGQRGLWRWRRSLPGVPEAAIVSLGEGDTPLVPTRLDGRQFLMKCDFCNPTGSWKDRGWTLAVSHLKAMGISHLYEDSSGNAGASLAAYGGRAGMKVSVFVPADIPSPKRRQIAAYGGEVIPISGGRDAVAAACVEAARDGFYAGHAWNPWFRWGPCTLAWEIVEDLDGRIPDAVVMPVGQGGILLGLFHGFNALHGAGRISGLPRLVAAQAAACAPVVRGWLTQADQVPPVEVGPTLADAIRTPRPVRYGEILEALRSTNGTALAISEEEIATAHAMLARSGLLVEPTSAVAAAAALRYGREAQHGDETVVVILTGLGLKALADPPTA
ncbi:MAG: pyridoxal-phosphate dependent enzyme [Acidobacteria bacterium]|nr:MAG: pyridoxal-phosphate dependent enzyme [Acidobacteriota bacterium]